MFIIKYTNFGGDHMCTKSELNSIIDAVVIGAKQLLGNRLDSVILYGSYARGDYNDESDIDIMVIINGSPDDLKQFRKSLVDIASDLSLEYDITVSLLLFDSETFSKYKNAMPFLMNVQKDGVKVA